MVDGAADAREALAAIPADLPRDEWVRVGMAAQAAGLGFDDFDAWSAQGDSYDQRAARDTWRSFEPGKGIGAATLFHIAGQHGHRRPTNGHSAAPARPAAASKAPRPGMGAAEVFDRLPEAPPDHPYIRAKDGRPDGLRVVPDGDPVRIAGHSVAGWLVVPVLPVAGGAPVSLQFIPPPGTGKKLNLPGASMAGVFIVGELAPGGTVYLCEGIGQAWACWKATGHAALCCFGWGNVGKATAELRRRDAAARLVLVPDGGKERDAMKIAAEHRAAVASMPPGSPANFDANDMAQRDGVDALEQLLAGAVQPPPIEDAGPGLVVTPADEFLRTFRIPDSLIDGLAPRSQLYSMTGPTGHAKTALATYMQIAIAMGLPFAGRAVERGRVGALLGENPDDAALRYLAQAQAMGISPTSLHPIGVVAGSFAIGPAFNDLAARFAAFGELAAVFVDTSAAYFDGDDENANTAMRLHASNLRRLTELPGRPTVFVLCHPTKHATKDNLLPRGGGAFLAEVDGNLTCWREGQLVTMHWAGKVRGPGFEPIQFELVPQVLAVADSKGRNVSSISVLPVNAERAETISAAGLDDENALLAAMRATPGGSVADLSTRAGFVTTLGPNKGRTHRVLQRLERLGLVAKARGGGWKLTPKGKTEAAEVSE